MEVNLKAVIKAAVPSPPIMATATPLVPIRMKFARTCLRRHVHNIVNPAEKTPRQNMISHGAAVTPLANNPAVLNVIAETTIKRTPDAWSGRGFATVIPADCHASPQRSPVPPARPGPEENPPFPPRPAQS